MAQGSDSAPLACGRSTTARGAVHYTGSRARIEGVVHGRCIQDLSERFTQFSTVHAVLTQEQTRPWRLEKHTSFGGGFDEFLPEMFSMHRRHAPRAYISDGGHYDNLGLLVLLRKRCNVIWCVDSQADKKGTASQLRDVVALADEELGIQITEIDFGNFRTNSDGLMGTTHGVAAIHYGTVDGVDLIGTLIVVKLGLSADSSTDLVTYRNTRDKQFPRHATFLYPTFNVDRMTHYVLLGRENTRKARAAYLAAVALKQADAPAGGDTPIGQRAKTYPGERRRS